jgi:FtsP/CotA-like multicopper oxidase with cupredoxin domain
MDKRDSLIMNRRDLLKMGSGVVLASAAALRTLAPKLASAQIANIACQGLGYIEVFPTSPFILNPFSDPLPIPAPMKPVSLAEMMSVHPAPGPGIGQQDSRGGTHQIWPSQLALPDPLLYRIQLQVRQHSFTTSRVLPIKNDGTPVTALDRALGYPRFGPQIAPASTIYGFNGTFPGPMIYATYGKPSLVRFENHLDENPLGLDRNDFGAPNATFLTHLHNGHTAPESDGNPHYMPSAYEPGMFVDNLYLNSPAGGDDNEKQSFFWFHDHKMDFTGADVYKGMVGLYPIYDPVMDYGNENDIANKKNLRLPGVPQPDGRIEYDIPLAFYDCCLDDGVTQHKDFHNGCGETHPEWWGQTFFRHFPNHGFVGDIFTVNGTAYPVLEVKRRKYRLRFLDASIARIYDFVLMSSTCGPAAAPGVQGQYQLPDGEQCMQFTQIASEGGLLPAPIVRNSIEIWPAKRREVVIDFSRYMDGSPTTKGDVIYLVNVKQMTTGRKPNDGTMVDDNGNTVPDPAFNPNYRVPVLKIVIGDWVPDNSVVPKKLRPVPVVDPTIFPGLTTREFTLERSGTFGGEYEWLINGEIFDPTTPLAFPTCGVPEIWTIANGGGGWVHPLHLHMEEHQVLSRNGVPTGQNPEHPDDNSKEDVVALAPGESVDIYRNFRTFTGPYVTHCHNLAHEDHAMMFGWVIVP